MAEITRQIGGRPRQGTLPQARSDEICPRIGTGEGWPGGKFCLAATKICYLWDVAMLKLFLSLSLQQLILEISSSRLCFNKIDTSLS